MNFNLTLIYQVIAFAVFIWLTMRYIWPPIVAAMEERQKRIADGLSAADRAERDLELAQQKASDELKEAKSQASEIIEQANRRAGQIVDEAKSQASTEGDRIIEQAQSEVDQQVHRSREELRAQVSQLAVEGAEKVLRREIDRDAHKQLLDELAAEL